MSLQKQMTFSKAEKDLIRLGRKQATERISKILEEHVWQLEVKHRILGFKWKQRCRCGFYGVFNEHLTALIKGGK